MRREELVPLDSRPKFAEVWESSEHFKRAFSHPEFRSHLGHYPASTRVSPHLFQKLAMPGICVS